MPLNLFSNKFSPKKGTPRKTPSLSNLNLDSTQRDTEFGIDYGPIRLKLGSNEILFDGGEWISGDSHSCYDKVLISFKLSCIICA